MYVQLVKEQFLLRAILRFAIQETKRRKLLHFDKCHSHLTNSLMSHYTNVQSTDFFAQGREYPKKMNSFFTLKFTVTLWNLRIV